MKPILALAAMLLGCPFLARAVRADESDGPRREISLSGKWLFQREGAGEGDWKSVRVPSSFESHEGTEWSGVGRYRRSIEPFELPAGKRALLHFQAAATEAEVSWNGEKLGSHLGGWTPFRFDVTDRIRKAPAGKPHEIAVRLDEKVGHNTQGFLPIIAPHFGGIWQEVKLIIVPETYVDDLAVLAAGNPERKRIDLEIPLEGSAAESLSQVTVRHRLRGEPAWNEARIELPAEAAGRGLGPGAAPRAAGCDCAPRRAGKLVLASVAVEDPKLWSPAEPNLYEVEIRLPGAGGSQDAGDRISLRAAFRGLEIHGEELRLSGRSLGVRGLLNWGYYPPLTAPNPGFERFCHDLRSARRMGFNLMKFCLWVPPKSYLDLADEMGFLCWMEYPTWHPSFTREHLDNLRREFREFFLYDRNHPSVILRSLTCETGAGADIEIIKDLYDRAHSMIPGAIVEDDSSWIGWNRIHDFYDDHPYGNNHTWLPTLRGFKEHILAHGAKPLLLGEAIAADTWVERKPLLDRVGDSRPFWVPGFFDAAAAGVEKARATWGPEGLESLTADSFRYCMLMRKYQVEAYRREMPYGGYVISVIRDFSSASMGLLDYQDRPKWPAEDWAWQRDTISLLRTPGDTRSFFGGESLRADLLVSHFGTSPLEAAELTVALQSGAGKDEIVGRLPATRIQQNTGTLAKVLDVDFPLPEVTAPQRVVLSAILKAGKDEFRSEWPLWVVPKPQAFSTASIVLHGSVPEDLAADLFPGVARLPEKGALSGNQVLVATRFDDDIVRILENGGRVLLLPDGGKASFPLSAHWFLRGAPYVSGHAAGRQVPRDLLVELQHFDLASDVIPEIGYLEAIDPLLLLWDTHDLKAVKTHGLIFETTAGGGRLLVSAVRHRAAPDAPNAAGAWLLRVLIDHLSAGPAPRRALSDDLWRHLKDKIHEEKIPLVEKVWRFKPDPKEEGVEKGWHSAALDESWKEIRIGIAWESQGFGSVDGWAWYRLAVKIPESWKGRHVYLTFEGVDDMYELYVGSRLVAKCGDRVAKVDTFNEKKSHDITSFVKPGEDCAIAVRVCDWYGAGGIFRPVTLATTGLVPGTDIIQ